MENELGLRNDEINRLTGLDADRTRAITLLASERDETKKLQTQIAQNLAIISAKQQEAKAVEASLDKILSSLELSLPKSAAGQGEKQKKQAALTVDMKTTRIKTLLETLSANQEVELADLRTAENKLLDDLLLRLGDPQEGPQVQVVAARQAKTVPPPELMPQQKKERITNLIIEQKRIQNVQLQNLEAQKAELERLSKAEDGLVVAAAPSDAKWEELKILLDRYNMAADTETQPKAEFKMKDNRLQTNIARLQARLATAMSLAVAADNTRRALEKAAQAGDSKAQTAAKEAKQEAQTARQEAASVKTKLKTLEARAKKKQEELVRWSDTHDSKWAKTLGIGTDLKLKYTGETGAAAADPTQALDTSSLGRLEQYVQGLQAMLNFAESTILKLDEKTKQEIRTKTAAWELERKALAKRASESEAALRTTNESLEQKTQEATRDATTAQEAAQETARNTEKLTGQIEELRKDVNSKTERILALEEIADQKGGVESELSGVRQSMKSSQTALEEKKLELENARRQAAAAEKTLRTHEGKLDALIEMLETLAQVPKGGLLSPGPAEPEGGAFSDDEGELSGAGKEPSPKRPSPTVGSKRKLSGGPEGEESTKRQAVASDSDPETKLSSGLEAKMRRVNGLIGSLRTKKYTTMTALEAAADLARSDAFYGEIAKRIGTEPGKVQVDVPMTPVPVDGGDLALGDQKDLYNKIMELQRRLATTEAVMRGVEGAYGAEVKKLKADFLDTSRHLTERSKQLIAKNEELLTTGKLLDATKSTATRQQFAIEELKAQCQHIATDTERKVKEQYEQVIQEQTSRISALEKRSEESIAERLQFQTPDTAGLRIGGRQSSRRDSYGSTDAGMVTDTDTDATMTPHHGRAYGGRTPSSISSTGSPPSSVSGTALPGLQAALQTVPEDSDVPMWEGPSTNVSVRSSDAETLSGTKRSLADGLPTVSGAMPYGSVASGVAPVVVSGMVPYGVAASEVGVLPVVASEMVPYGSATPAQGRGVKAHRTGHGPGSVVSVSKRKSILSVHRPEPVLQMPPTEKAPKDTIHDADFKLNPFRELNTEIPKKDVITFIKKLWDKEYVRFSTGQSESVPTSVAKMIVLSVLRNYVDSDTEHKKINYAQYAPVTRTANIIKLFRLPLAECFSSKKSEAVSKLKYDAGEWKDTTFGSVDGVGEYKFGCGTSPNLNLPSLYVCKNGNDITVGYCRASDSKIFVTGQFKIGDKVKTGRAFAAINLTGINTAATSTFTFQGGEPSLLLILAALLPPLEFTPPASDPRTRSSDSAPGTDTGSVPAPDFNVMTSLFSTAGGWIAEWKQSEIVNSDLSDRGYAAAISFRFRGQQEEMSIVKWVAQSWLQDLGLLKTRPIGVRAREVVARLLLKAVILTCAMAAGTEVVFGSLGAMMDALMKAIKARLVKPLGVDIAMRNVDGSLQETVGEGRYSIFPFEYRADKKRKGDIVPALYMNLAEGKLEIGIFEGKSVRFFSVGPKVALKISHALPALSWVGITSRRFLDGELDVSRLGADRIPDRPNILAILILLLGEEADLQTKPNSFIISKA
jgi:hypothetical protein